MLLNASINPLTEDDMPMSLPNLPNLDLRFFVPRLQDRPQNPIVDGLKFTSVLGSTLKQAMVPKPPLQLSPLSAEAEADRLLSSDQAHHRMDWASLPRLDTPITNEVMSWDILLADEKQPEESPFLSERSTHAFAVARHHILPRMINSECEVIHVTSHQLFSALQMTVLGASSALHHWDPSSETFVLSRPPDKKSAIMLIDGKDEVITDSLLRRFLLIGTIIRRLEVLTNVMKSRANDNKPTHYAFIHALSSVLAHTRQRLAGVPSIKGHFSLALEQLSSSWLDYAPYEELMFVLGSLCHRDLDTSQANYRPMPSTAARLLSHIYSHLSEQIDGAASKMVTATLAYILTATSRSYLKDICTSVGFVTDPGAAAEGVKTVLGASDADPQDEQDDYFLDDLGAPNAFPSFAPTALAEALPRAQRSLKLLRAAAPDHPLLQSQEHRPPAAWFWTESEVNSAWIGNDDEVESAHPLKDEQLLSEQNKTIDALYKPELAVFRLFDLEPNSKLPASSPSNVAQPPEADIQQFMFSFPDQLPILTPTLLDLADLVFEPLLAHTGLLAESVVSVFLDDSSHLHLRSHLLILRSHLLLTSQAFKSRLESALFSDADEQSTTGSGGGFSSHARQLSKSSTRSSTSVARSVWPVGLASGLMDNDTWPPGGSDLSFYLRTVIVDSLQESAAEVGIQENAKVWREAESRLGFALRELPTTGGKARWLNPLAVEALDFLYMDYKPPSPLGVLIPPELVSKYQRMFTFILRITRVENATRALFRMSRDTRAPLFPTLARSDAHFQHFRSVAHAFATSLSSYVFDTAIRGHFDGFLAELAPTSPDSSLSASTATARARDAQSRARPPRFADVFELARRHSDVLDGMLSACLLRSGQKPVGDLLHACLERVLELAVLAGELRSGRLQEYRGAPALEDLWDAFRGKMGTLVKALKGLVDKGSVGARYDDLKTSRAGRRVSDERESLRDLLTRLDFNEWWRQAPRTSSSSGPA